MIDWRDLFARYANYVGEMEGTDFLDSAEWADWLKTDEERAAVIKVREDAEQDREVQKP